MIIKPQFKLKEYENGLYLVSTPLGNLKDITLRAIEVLQQSHYILCEDTRVSKNLLDKYQIKSKLISNHKFNEKKNVVKIIEYLKSGKIISLISDAGTPSISDPGSILVNECINNEIKIFPIPGPSAEGPGMGNILISLLIHSLTKIEPGSEILGVPASDIKEIIFPDFRYSIIFTTFFFSLNL